MKFLILMFTLVLNACGTDVGNPGLVPASGSNGNPTSNFMSEAMCNKLHVCNPTLSFGTCYTGIHSATGLTAAMGLNATTYPTLNAAETAVTTGALVVNSANLNQCTLSINALNCVDTRVTSAYTTTAATNFNNTYQLLSADSICAHTTNP